MVSMATKENIGLCVVCSLKVSKLESLLESIYGVSFTMRPE